MQHHVRLAAIATAAVLTAPAQAQEKTPEAASLFLETALKDVPITGSTGLQARYREFLPARGGGCVLNARMENAAGISITVPHDFSMTLKVETIGEAVRETRRTRTDTRHFTYEIGSKAQAERVRAAIELLRKHCGSQGTAES